MLFRVVKYILLQFFSTIVSIFHNKVLYLFNNKNKIFMKGPHTHSHRLTDTEDIKRYIKAGNGTFTLHNVQTDVRYTFSMRKPRENKNATVSFFSIKEGHGYRWCGTVGLKRMSYTIGRKHGVPKRNHVSHRTMSWILKMIHGELSWPDHMHFYHEGTCGVCGKKLTNPESIRQGVGPICGTRV